MTGKKYVWYASYGSNLSRDRFLCYIRGGQPEGSADREVGCRDKTLPQKDRSMIIPYPLYFSRHSQRWNGAPAFIGHQKSDRHHTIGRMYLITEQQFLDVVKQENNNKELALDLSAIGFEGSQSIDDSSWYGRVVHLGEEEGYPVFTFTAPWDTDEIDLAGPSLPYLSTIIRGIKEMQELDEEEILKYLSIKPGIQGIIPNEQLKKWILSTSVK